MNPGKVTQGLIHSFIFLPKHQRRAVFSTSSFPDKNLCKVLLRCIGSCVSELLYIINIQERDAEWKGCWICWTASLTATSELKDTLFCENFLFSYELWMWFVKTVRAVCFWLEFGFSVFQRHLPQGPDDQGLGSPEVAGCLLNEDLGIFITVYLTSRKRTYESNKIRQICGPRGGITQQTLRMEVGWSPRAWGISCCHESREDERCLEKVATWSLRSPERDPQRR